jgi:anthranilate synthase component 1
MEKVEVKVIRRRILADIITPVSIYLKIRDIYPNSMLLESSDYHSKENSASPCPVRIRSVRLQVRITRW